MWKPGRFYVRTETGAMRGPFVSREEMEAFIKKTYKNQLVYVFFCFGQYNTTEKSE